MKIDVIKKETIFIVFAATLIFIVAIVTISHKPAVTTQFPNRVQEVLPSVVHIMCDSWQGSGVAISEDIIVTARHVVDGINYTITLNDGTVVKGTQAITHKDYDIGFIKLDIDSVNKLKLGEKILGEKLLKPAKFGSIKDCVLGQPVFIIGSPYGKINFNSVTLGIISGLDIDWDGLSYSGEPYGWKVAFTSDSGAHPGNSGGPVFSMDGIVRGLLVGGYSPVLNCSMPCDLFLMDIEVVKLMFVFEKYKIEEKKESWNGYSQEWKDSCSLLKITKSGKCAKCHRAGSNVTISVDIKKQDTKRVYYKVSGSSDSSDKQGWAVYNKKDLIVKGSGKGTFDLPKGDKIYRVYWVDKKSTYIEIKVK